MCKIDNNLYNSFLDWNMFFNKWLKNISKENFYSNLLYSIQQNENKLNLYVHWFFCKSECIYCPYLKQLWKLNKSELEKNINKIEENLYDFIAYLEKVWIDSKTIKIDTISYGGWTPSYIPYEYLESITKLLIKSFDFTPKEFTIEINPTIEDYNNIKPLKQYWLNRISIGIQTFDKDITIKTWRWLKNKNVETVIKQAYEDFWNINIDMIYWLPWQTSEMLNVDLDKIIELKDYISHISYYPLYVFPWTTLYNNFKTFEDILPFYDKGLEWFDSSTNETKIGGYNYNKIIEWWKIINNKLLDTFEFYTMDYLVNKKEIHKKHLYQVKYLNNNPLYPLWYWYGSTYNTFINDYKYYMYKTGKDVLLKDILLWLRLFNLKILEENIWKDNINDVLWFSIEKMINKINNKEYYLQYYLQSFFLGKLEEVKTQ